MDRFGIFAANNVDLGDAFAETLVITRQPKPSWSPAVPSLTRSRAKSRT